MLDFPSDIGQSSMSLIILRSSKKFGVFIGKIRVQLGSQCRGVYIVKIFLTSKEDTEGGDDLV